MTVDNDKIVEDGQGGTPPAETPPVEPPIDNSEISTKSFEELMAEDDGEEWTEDNPKPEPKKEDKKEPEPPPAPVKEEPKQPIIDPEKLKSDLKTEISQEVAQRVVESLSGDKKEPKEQYPWEKENRNPTYKEALDYVSNSAAEKVKIDLKQEAEDEEKAERETQEAQEKQASEVRQAWDTYWDGQLTELESTGKIPSVKDPNDKNDEGRLARIALFTKMQSITDQNLKSGKPAVMNLKEVYYEHFAGKINSKPPGASAPVHGSRKAVSGGDRETFSNDEIRNKSFEDILMGK